MPDSDSDSKSRRGVLALVVAAGAGLIKLGDELPTLLSKFVDELLALWKDIRPQWFSKARWALKLVWAYKLATGETIQKRLEIPPNNYALVELDSRTNSRLQYRIESSSPIDVLLFTPSEYNKYIEQEDANYISAGSRLSTRAANVQTGIDVLDTYYLVVDNSRWGRTTPDGQSTTAEFTVALRPV